MLLWELDSEFATSMAYSINVAMPLMTDCAYDSCVMHSQAASTEAVAEAFFDFFITRVYQKAY